MRAGDRLHLDTAWTAAIFSEVTMNRYVLGAIGCVALVVTAAEAKLDAAGVAAETSLEDAVLCQVVVRAAENSRVRPKHGVQDWDSAVEVVYGSSTTNPDHIEPEPRFEELTAGVERRRGTTKRDEIEFTEWLGDKVSQCDEIMAAILES
jgi:hypothetical protein